MRHLRTMIAVVTLGLGSDTRAAVVRVTSPTTSPAATLLRLRGGVSSVDQQSWWRGPTDRSYCSFYCHEGRLAAARKHMREACKGRESSCWPELRGAVELAARGSTDGPLISADRLEAANKLVTNHKYIAADMTNQSPLTQSQLVRLPQDALSIADEFLSAIARVLLGLPVSNEPMIIDEDTAKLWRRACSYLASRLQTAENNVRGREPDMSPPAGEALRTALEEVSSAVTEASSHIARAGMPRGA